MSPKPILDNMENNDKRQRLIDRMSYLQDQRDKYVEELIETK